MTVDIFVQNYLSSIRSVTLTEVFYVASSFFDASQNFFLLVVLVCALVYIVRGRGYALLLALSLFSSAIAVALLKWFFNIGRPLDYVVSAFGQSFPSYHATIATVFFLMLMYIFDPHFSRITRIFFNAACFTGIFIVGFSRVYLGAHWLTDVLAGVLLGFLFAYLSVIVFNVVMNRRGKASMIR